MFLWWVGSRPTAPTPNLGHQDFLSGLSLLDFGVPTPLLQGNKICNPRQGPLQGAISRRQLIVHETPNSITRYNTFKIFLSSSTISAVSSIQHTLSRDGKKRLLVHSVRCMSDVIVVRKRAGTMLSDDAIDKYFRFFCVIFYGLRPGNLL
jgi:hypothetical protein